jgi:hypothetical protein
VVASSAEAQTPIVYDSFTGANGSLLTTHTPDTSLPGRPWTSVLGATPTLSGGHLVRATGTQVALIDGGTPDATVGVWWYPNPQAGTGLDAGLVFRAVDAYNFFLFQMYQDRLILYRVVNGQWTQLWLSFLEGGEPRTGSHYLQAVLSGSTITLNWDWGAQSYTTTDSAHINATKHGLRSLNTYEAVSTYDHFSIGGVLPAEPATTAIAPAHTTMYFGAQQTLGAHGYTAGGASISGLPFIFASSDPMIAKVYTLTLHTALIVGTGAGTATITATPVRGPVAATTVTIDPGSTIVFDSFTGSTGVALTTHAPEVNQVGQAWTASGATPTLASQRLAPTAATLALIDGGTPDAAVSVWWQPNPTPSTGLQADLVFRAVNATNFFTFQMYQDRLILYRVVNGAWTQLWLSFLEGEPSRTQAHRLDITLSGSSITVSWDQGVQTFATTDVNHLTATKYGVRATGYDLVSTYDDFRVTGTLTPPPAQVVVTPAVNNLLFGQTVTVTARAYDAANVEIPNVAFAWTTSNGSILPFSVASLNSAWITAAGLGTATLTATPARGPSGSATAAITAGATLVHDTFTNANGTLLTAHTPVVDQIGGGWSVSATLTPGITGNRSQALVTGSDAHAIIDAGTANPSISVWWHPNPVAETGLEAGIVFRATDAQNFFLFRMYQNRVQLYRVMNGQWTELWLRFLEGGEPQGGAHQLGVDLAGAMITVHWNDGVEIFATQDYFNMHATRHGLRFAAYDGVSSYDDFRMLGTLQATAASVVVTPATATLPFHGYMALQATAYDAGGQVIPNMPFQWSTATPTRFRLGAFGLASTHVVAMTEGTGTVTATPARGASGSATLTVNPGSTLVYDTFTGGTGTPLATHPPDVQQMGSAWTVTGTAGAQVTGNRVGVAGTGTNVIALTEGGSPDVTVGVTWHPAHVGTDPAANAGGLIARASDTQNHLMLRVWDVYVELLKVSLGATTVLGQVRLADDYFRDGAPHQLQVQLAGSAVNALVDGVMRVQVTESFNQGATRAGLAWWPAVDATSTVDDFSISGALPPLVSSLTVTPGAIALAPYESLTVTATPRNGSGTALPDGVVSWSSSDLSVARVHSTSRTTAVITPLGDGTAMITAWAPRGTPPPAQVTTNVRTCVSALSDPDERVLFEGGSIAVPVTAPVGCGWQGVPLANWLSMASGAVGSGTGSVVIAVDANDTAHTRSAGVAIGGRLFTVVQDPNPAMCVTGLSPGDTMWDATGGDDSFGVVADPACPWRVTSSDPSWLVPLDDSGAGSGSPSYRVLPNHSVVERSAMLNVGPGGFLVTQAAGTAGNGSACTYASRPSQRAWAKRPPRGRLPSLPRHSVAGRPRVCHRR